MKIINNIQAFIWKSMSANNCNTYLIDGPTRVLIDPGHSNLFDHVREGLMKLGLTPEDIGLIIIFTKKLNPPATARHERAGRVMVFFIH